MPPSLKLIRSGQRYIGPDLAGRSIIYQTHTTDTEVVNVKQLKIDNEQIGGMIQMILQSMFILSFFTFANTMNISKINVELCSQCNLKCLYCELEHNSKRKKIMDIDVYEKLLIELTKYEYSIDLFALSHSAEVLLHPQFEEFVTMTKEYIDKGFKPKKIFMNTNLMLLTQKKIDFIINCGVFDWIVCSIDGKNKSSFERLRPPAKYDKILKNFNYLVEKNNQTGHNIQIDINNGNDSESKNEALDTLLEGCFKKADMVYHYNFHNWSGNVDNPEHKQVKMRGFCQFSFNTVVLTVDGMISKCCSDLNGNTIYGNFNKNSLKHIYNSKTRKFDLIKMLLKQRQLVKGCEKCSRN